VLRNKILTGFIGWALFFGTAFAQDRPVFSTVDYPGAVSTNAQGINPGGDIVGFYKDTLGKQHGFLLRGGNFTSIDYPGAIATDARGISPPGDIVGSFTNAPGGPANIHGYLWSRGTFTEVQFPGYLGTIAQRITPNGDIYGCNHNMDMMGSMHGLVLSAAGYTQLDVPASMHTGATPDGSTIVGLYTDLTTGLTHGYFLQNGNFEPFDVSGSNFTAAWDINPSGAVVGVFRDATGKVHGFLLSDGAATTIDYPGAIATRAFGINPGGDVVGAYVDSSGKTHGFLRKVTD
jgi:probable HAF family extracellular repeat protein